MSAGTRATGSVEFSELIQKKKMYSDKQADGLVHGGLLWLLRGSLPTGEC